jgi:hypothetical protein
LPGVVVMDRAASSAPTERGSSRLGLQRLVLLFLLVTLGWPSGALASWQRSYESAQRALLAGEFAEAEASLLGALRQREEPGCRLRLYGVKYRDYLPWYYLGVVRQSQGKNAEAREALVRSAAEGVALTCATSKTQAHDLSRRLAALRAEAAGLEPELALGAPGSDMDVYREEALAAGAMHWRSEALLALDDRRRTLAEGDEKAEHRLQWDYLALASRVRTEAPILALLERDAREAISRTRLVAARVANQNSAALEDARRRLEAASSGVDQAKGAAAWLQLETEAEAAREVFEEARRQGDAEARERRWRRRAELELQLSLARNAALEVQPELHGSSDWREAQAELEQAAKALRGDGGSALTTAVTRAARARGLLVGLARLEVPRRDLLRVDRREVLGLAWSEAAGAMPGAILDHRRRDGAELRSEP